MRQVPRARHPRPGLVDGEDLEAQGPITEMLSTAGPQDWFV